MKEIGFRCGHFLINLLPSLIHNPRIVNVVSSTSFIRAEKCTKEGAYGGFFDLFKNKMGKPCKCSFNREII